MRSPWWTPKRCARRPDGEPLGVAAARAGPHRQQPQQLRARPADQLARLRRAPSFGVRGLRLYTDGIPATMPDGSGQVTHFDLAGAERIEVLRGPFSALYGNSSGGVIALFSGPARKRELEFDLDLGSNGRPGPRHLRLAPAAGGTSVPACQGFTTDGFRPQSAARRWLGNVRLGWQGERDQCDARQRDRPAGRRSARSQARAVRCRPVPDHAQAIAFDTRKQAEQQQVGGQMDAPYGVKGFAETTLAAYRGRRAVTQWQAIPAGHRRRQPASPRRRDRLLPPVRRRRCPARSGAGTQPNWWRARPTSAGATTARATRTSSARRPTSSSA